MPRLSSERQEKFANLVANGYNLKTAYLEAGYTIKGAAQGNASKLASKPEIKARIEELMYKSAERDSEIVAPPLPIKKKKGPKTTIDLDWVNKEYIFFLNTARELGDVKNAITILKDLSDLNRVRAPEPESENNNNNNKNRMLISNDKSHMGAQTSISIIYQEPESDGGDTDRFVEIKVPDSGS